MKCRGAYLEGCRKIGASAGKAKLAPGARQRVEPVLEEALLCFTGAEETCQAEWTDFEGLDGKAPLWRVPAARMKMKGKHLIPLTPRAVEVLRRFAGAGRQQREGVRQSGEQAWHDPPRQAPKDAGVVGQTAWSANLLCRHV